MHINSFYHQPNYNRHNPSEPDLPPPISKNHKRKIFFILFVFLVGGFFLWFQKSETKTPDEIAIEEQPSPPEQILGEKKEPEKIVNYVISEGDIPAEVFFEYGKLDANAVANLLLSAEDVYDFTNLKIGQKIDFIFSEDDELKRIEYYQNSENFILAKLEEENFKVSQEKIPYETKTEKLHVEIDEFLYKDALDAGLTDASILEVADIFSFDIDFTTEIRKGDEMSIYYEKRTLNGEPAPDGKVLAAKFINEGEEYFGYYYELEGEGGHYDSEGKELLRQFLRAPLSYRRITSGYTGARLHPITKTVTAHYQIDYAAPIGTPVVATARGTVTSAGYEGGWGNMVRLRHDNGYSTHYGHLSAYGKNIKAGTSVSQGQVIGYVGSTGWSTGPHLDYGMRLNGSPINPLSLKLPKGTPLEGADLENFQKIKQEYDQYLK
jgi:murein DD-endopeptidase MepM/ murein hydrolase activator NlpD